MGRITFVCLCLTGFEVLEESRFIDIKYVFQLVSVDYFEQFFTLPVHHCFGIYNGTFSLHSLVYQVVSNPYIHGYLDEQLHVEPSPSGGVH